MWLLYIFTNGYIGPCVCVYDFRFVNMHHLCLICNQADLRQSIQVCIHYIDKLLFNTKHSYFLNICIQYATPTLFCMVLNKIIGKFLHHNLMNIIIIIFPWMYFSMLSPGLKLHHWIESWCYTWTEGVQCCTPYLPHICYLLLV